MRVALFTEFPPAFLDLHVLPELRRRGVVVVVGPERTSAAKRIDLGSKNLDLVLHMTEMGSHSNSEALSRACRSAGVPVRSLSRKKASWTFLPPPSEVEPESPRRRTQENPVNHANQATKPDDQMNGLYEAEIADLKKKVEEQRRRADDAEKRAADAERGRYAKRSKILSACLVLHAEGLLTAEELVAKVQSC